MSEVESPAPPSKPSNVIEALALVMKELPGIGRDQTGSQYSYRGIEQITAAAQKLLAKHGVVFVPHVESRDVKDITLGGKPWTQDCLAVRYRVYGPGGREDFIDVGPLYGLGNDNSDKGANKAMTQAFKYALIQTLCIGDHKDDVDGYQSQPESTPADVLAQLYNRLDAEQRKKLKDWWPTALPKGESWPAKTLQRAASDEDNYKLAESAIRTLLAGEEPEPGPLGDPPPDPPSPDPDGPGPKGGGDQVRPDESGAGTTPTTSAGEPVNPETGEIVPPPPPKPAIEPPDTGITERRPGEGVPKDEAKGKRAKK